MVKKENQETEQSQSEPAEPIVKHKTERMHTIILKEKDKDGNFLCMDVDMILPSGIFGEGFPLVMGIVDDRAYFLPFSQMNWFEQNFGVKKDAKLAQTMQDEIQKKRNKKYVDASII